MILRVSLPIEDIVQAFKMNGFGSEAEKCGYSAVWCAEANMRRSDPSPARVMSGCSPFRQWSLGCLVEHTNGRRAVLLTIGLDSERFHGNRATHLLV